MLKNESIEEFLNRIKTSPTESSFGLFDDEESILIQKICTKHNGIANIINKLMENGFSQFKIGVIITTIKIEDQFMLLEKSKPRFAT